MKRLSSLTDNLFAFNSNIQMKRLNLIFFTFLVLFFVSCNNYKRLINDEVVFNDGDSQTGTILKSDSVNIRLKKIDESVITIPWSIIDTVQGKKFRTLWLGFNAGIYNTPYFSVFRNESFSNSAGAVQFKIGMAYRGIKMYYLNYSYTPTTPYPVNKIGVGFQRYVFGNYLYKRSSFFVGVEANGMSIRYNNGLQFTYEPFTGFEVRVSNRIKIHAKFSLQFNVFNKNNQTGAGLSIGAHFIKRNFKKHYDRLNTEKRF